MNNERNRIIFTWLSKRNPVLVSCLLIGFYLFILFFLTEIYYNTYFEPSDLGQEKYIHNPNWDTDVHQNTIKLILALSTLINGFITYLMFRFKATEGEKSLEYSAIVFLLFLAFSIHFLFLEDYGYFTIKSTF